MLAPEPISYHARVTARPPISHDPTLLMAQAAEGDGAAAERLLPLVYDQLRGGPGPRDQPIGDMADLACRDPEEILRFDEVFRRLEDESPEGAALARLRFFAGLSVEQTAAALGLSTSTVDRRWAFARAWLFRQLHGAE